MHIPREPPRASSVQQEAKPAGLSVCERQLHHLPAVGSHLWVQDGDEGVLEELVAIEGKVISHPTNAGCNHSWPEVVQARPVQVQCTLVLNLPIEDCEILTLSAPHLTRCNETQLSEVLVWHSKGVAP